MSRRNAGPRCSAVVAMAVWLLPVMAAPSYAARALWQTGADYYTWPGGYYCDKVGDFNGDGYDDLMTSHPTYSTSTRGWIHLTLGGSFVSAFREVVFEGAGEGVQLGLAMSHAGDLDNDGFDDIVVGRLNGQQQEIVVFRGDAELDRTEDLVIPWTNIGNRFVLGAAGDLNADGYGDFAVGDTDPGTNHGRVSVFFGGPVLDGISDRVFLGGAEYDWFGGAFAGERDLNGDGFMDLAIGAGKANAPGLTEAGEVRIFYGGPGVDVVPDVILHGPSDGAQFGVSLSFLADFDGDGFCDLVVAAGRSSYPDHKVSVFRGGPAFDSIPDWGVNARPPVAAGDDVNRDGFSDVLAYSGNVFFGGSPADTLPDTPLVPEPFSPAGFSPFAAGDLNGDGYQDWLVLWSSGSIHMSAVLTLCTASPNYLFSSIGRAVSGSPTVVGWQGEDVGDLQYSAGGSSWQTLASGVGGAAQNQTTVVIPPGRTSSARIRLMSAVNDSNIVTTGTFTVHDSIEAICMSAVRSGDRTLVSWNVEWFGYPSGTARYRLYRGKPGGSEVQVGPDPLGASGWIDTLASIDSRYRLTVVRPDGVELPIDSVATITAPCATVTFRAPLSPYWTGSTTLTWESNRSGPVDIALSQDGGQTWTTVYENLTPSTITGSAVPSEAQPSTYFYQGIYFVQQTLNARLRIVLHGSGGTVWGESPASFQLNATPRVDQVQASSVVGGGVALQWDVHAEVAAFEVDHFAARNVPLNPGQFGLAGYQLWRTDPGSSRVLITASPLTTASYLDHDGTSQSSYELFAALANHETLRLASIIPSGLIALPGAAVQIWPSPVRRNESLQVRLAGAMLGSEIQVNDLETQVVDIAGRVIAWDRRPPNTGAFRWVAAEHGAHAGVYWMRLRSKAAQIDRTFKFVVLD